MKINRRKLRQRLTSLGDTEPGPGHSEVDQDSGYNSQTDHESKPQAGSDIHIERKIREFYEAGVILSNPCNDTLDMMDAEFERWEL